MKNLHENTNSCKNTQVFDFAFDVAPCLSWLREAKGTPAATMPQSCSLIWPKKIVHMVGQDHEAFFKKKTVTANLKSWCHSMHYFRQNFDVSNLTLHDNTCLWWGLAVGCLDVTFIAVGWKNLLATGMDDCGGHCHTQSQVRPLGCAYMLCVCTRACVRACMFSFQV